MYLMIPKQSVLPNVHFKHGDVAQLKIYTKHKHLHTGELRAKDLNSDSKLPDDERRTLYLKDDVMTIDARAWPVTKAEYSNLTYELVRLTGGVHTPRFDLYQVETFRECSAPA